MRRATASTSILLFNSERGRTSNRRRYKAWRSVRRVMQQLTGKLGGFRDHAAPPRFLGVSAAVVPQPPASSIASSATQDSGRLSFRAAFGALGLPMLLVLLVCLVWTSWLVGLAVAPTWTANYLMDTADFDDGNFWLIVGTEPWMKVLSIAGLVFVALGYLYVLLKMLVWRNRTSSVASSVVKRVSSSRYLRRAARTLLSEESLERWSDLTGFHGSRRKLWVRLGPSHRI